MFSHSDRPRLRRAMRRAASCRVAGVCDSSFCYRGVDS